MLKNNTIFLDRNVIYHSVILEPATEESSIEWGSHTVSGPIHGYRRKKLPEKEELKLLNDIASIPTIALLAKRNQIRLYKGQEVHFEGLSVSISANGTKGDLFRNVEIKIVDSPIDRSYFKSQSLDQIWDGEELIEFCDTLLNLNVDMLSGVPKFWNQIPERMRANLNQDNLSRFKVILNALPHRKHWPDAFHLWTAETHGAAYFATVDYKFINALTMTAKIELPTKLVSPSKLLDELCIEDREPLPFDGEGFISLALVH